MVCEFSAKIEFSDDYYKKLGLKDQNEFNRIIDPAVNHALHDAENICRREAPIDTGNLRRSIHKNKRGLGRGELRSRAHYWVYLQYGTSKMPANPFVTRTVKKVSPELKKYVLEELERSGVLK